MFLFFHIVPSEMKKTKNKLSNIVNAAYVTTFYLCVS